MLFRDRNEAGKMLAQKLAAYADSPDLVVLALPRGGVPVAYQVAMSLKAPLDLFLVRKLGVPGQREVAMGAVASRGVRVINEDVVNYLNISPEVIEQVGSEELQLINQREHAYRGDRPMISVEQRKVILIDDGLASGATMRAAIKALRHLSPARIIVAVPVAAPATCEQLSAEADEVVCTVTPEPFQTIGRWYQDFTQLTDDEVRALLDRADRQAKPRAA